MNSSVNFNVLSCLCVLYENITLYFSLRYPPYSDKKMNTIGWVMGKKIKHGGGLFRSYIGFIKLILIGIVIGTVGKVSRC